MKLQVVLVLAEMTKKSGTFLGFSNHNVKKSNMGVSGLFTFLLSGPFFQFIVKKNSLISKLRTEPFNFQMHEKLSGKVENF